jgi:hypothetical protein
VRLRVKRGGFLDRGGRIVGQEGRHFERHPPVQTLRRVVDRAKQRRGLTQIFDRELEDQLFTGHAFAALLPNGVVVEMRVFDRMIEDRRVRRQPGHRPFFNVPAQCAAGQQPTGDVVEPQALAEIVQSGGGTCRGFCRHVILTCPSCEHDNQPTRRLCRSGQPMLIAEFYDF